MFRDLCVLCLVFIVSNCKINAIQNNQTQNETLEVCRKEYFVAKFINSNTSISKEELVKTKHCAHNTSKTNLQNTLSIIYVFNTALKKYFYWLHGELVKDAADWGSVLFVTNDFETITQYYNFGQDKVKAYQEFIPVTAGSNYTFMLFSIPSNRHTLQLNMKAPDACENSVLETVDKKIVHDKLFQKCDNYPDLLDKLDVASKFCTMLPDDKKKRDQKIKQGIMDKNCKLTIRKVKSEIRKVKSETNENLSPVIIPIIGLTVALVACVIILLLVYRRYRRQRCDDVAMTSTRKTSHGHLIRMNGPATVCERCEEEITP